MAHERGAWLDWITNGRVDVAMAVVLLAFIYYKGGLRLVTMLVVAFLFFVTLYHLSSWLIRRYIQYRNRAKQLEITAGPGREPTNPH